jgi:signal transduction histidine kinase/CheY-like chemotaxis protein
MELKVIRGIWKNNIPKNIFLMIGFGILSLILAQIRFYIPGMSGGTTDLCEVAVLTSVFYLPHWIYMIGVAIITSLIVPAEGSVLTTFIMHAVAGIFAWVSFSFIRKEASNVYFMSFLWALMVIVYYTVFLMPLGVIGSSLAGMIGSNSKIDAYINILITSRFELFTTASSTTLFLALKQISGKLETKNIQLQTALFRAKESDRLKSAFIANMSHEIRTPMNGIVGFSSLLVESNVSAQKRKDYGELIISSSNQLLSIINSILDISKIEAGTNEVNNSPTDLNSLLHNIESFYKPQAEEKKLLFEVRSQITVEDSNIITDRGKLKQIIDNLLNNAFKFTNEGHVILGCEKLDKFLRFYVEDTGIGIEAAYHKRIFERFAQVDVVEGWNYGGTGLGLAISKGLIELLGGNIMLSSKMGQGSVFSFTIPFVPFSIESPESLKESNSIMGIGRLANPTILIAEDEAINYQYLYELLSSWQAKIIRAENGKEAVELCRKNPDLDLILMDIKMPILNGLEATRQIRYFRPEIPIIAQTAYAMVDDWKNAIEAGCNDYLTKPITEQSLYTIIAKYLKSGKKGE